MTIREIKQELGQIRIDFCPTVDEEGAETPYLRHWDDESRTAVVAHKDLVQKMTKNSELPLGFKKQERVSLSKKKPYSNIILFEKTDVVASF